MIRAALAAALVLTSIARAQPEGALGSYFGFEPPRVLVIDDGCGPAVAADFNNDGLPDLAVVNNAKSRIELYLLRDQPRTDAEIERALRVNDLPPNRHYDRVLVSVRQRLGAIVPADVDGDDRIDLVVAAADPTEVVVLRQEAPGRFDRHSARRVRGLSGAAVATVIADLGGDDRVEVAVIAEEQIMLMPLDREGRLGEPSVLARAAGLRALYAEDFDGDGLTDLLGVCPNEAAPLRLWRQSSSASVRGLGAELRFDLPGLIEVEPVRFADRRAASIGVIERASRRVVLHDLATIAEEGGDVAAQVEVRAFPDGASRERGVALFDADGDGRRDLIATDTQANAILIFPAQSDGSLGAPRRSPAFKKPVAVAGGVWGSGEAVFVASTEEAAVGAARVDADGLPFPTPIVLATAGAEPIAIAHAGAEPMLAVVAKDRRDLVLEIHRPEGPPNVVKLEGVDREPTRILPTDADGDGTLDLLLLAERQAPVVVRGDAQSGTPSIVLKPAAPANAGLVSAAGPANSALADLDGDGLEELLFASANFVRVCRFDGSAWSVVDQINAPDPRSELVGVAVLGAGRVAASAAGGELIEFVRTEAGAWRVASTRRMLGFPAGPLMPWGQGAVLCFSDEAFAVARLSGERVVLEEVAVHRSESEDRVEHEMEVGDVNSDGYLDLVVLDAGEQMCQILTTTASRRLLEATEFKVFESRLFQGGTTREYQPSAAIVADLTGDGADDILLVVHDRLMIYPQDTGE